MRGWRRGIVDRPIVTRLVLTVAGTMAVVLLTAGAFVFWRVQFALDRQLDEDLHGYQELVDRAVRAGSTPANNSSGESYQVYDTSGRVRSGDADHRLVTASVVRRAAGGAPERLDVGRLLPAAAHPVRIGTTLLRTPRGPVVVAAAVSRSRHDEALRELLLQLAIADLATLAAASFVGYRVARAALDPVEWYRLAAGRAEQTPTAPLLPVEAGKDDEVTRLGHTFNALLERIGAANERERQFLADTSHELRSPLSVMRAELEVALLRPRGEQETRAALESMRDQVERLITLSNALLDLEELRATGVPADEVVDLPGLVADVVGRYAAAAEAQRRPLESHCPAAELRGNAHWLDLALGNLVSNALRYGAGTIRVVVEQTEGRTLLSVGDEGAGFPEGFSAKAFDRFSRAETSRTSGGTGLGLALVQAVAQAHGGVASIAGARVTLDLPSAGPTD